MTKRAFSSNLTLLAGVLAALVIVVSQAFRQEACSYLSRINTEQADQATDQKAFVEAPSDAVTAAQAAEKADTNPSVICEILLDEENVEAGPSPDRTILNSLLKTLARTVISPQAP